MDKFPIHRISFSSSDYEEFATMLKNGNVEERLLEPGAFFGTVKMVFTPHLLVGDFHINKKVLQLGTGAPGYITFGIWNPSVIFTWRKHKMREGMVGILWKKEHRSVTGGSFNGLPLSIEENYFSHLCRLRGYPELIDKVAQSDCLMVSETILRQIREVMMFVTRYTGPDDRMIHELIEGRLLELLMNALISTLDEQPDTAKSHSKFSRIIDYIHGNLTDLTSVYQISEQTDIPVRTLRRLFQKKYDLTPKGYLNNLRLNEVRKSLKKDKGASNIFQVASEYNFWHMGQFARDYKKLFGELPSETVGIPL